MDAKEFIELVQAMRSAQNAFYKNGRKQSDLIEAKQLEKQVDAALKAGITNEAEPAQQEADEKSQPTLWNHDPSYVEREGTAFNPYKGKPK